MHISTVAISMKKALKWSFFWHLASFIILFMFGQKFFGIDLFKREKKVEFIKSAVKVDIVAMPEETLKKLKSISIDLSSVEDDVSLEKPIRNEALEKQTGEVTFKKKTDKKSFLKKLKNLSKRDIKEKSKKKRKVKKVENSNKLEKLILQGNKISKGASVTGAASKDLDTFNSYALGLPDLIRPFWKLPSFLKNNRELRCIIQVFIGRNGEVIRSKIYESSGEEEYDRRALNAVAKAAPFPVPDKSIISKLKNGAIVLGFPL